MLKVTPVRLVLPVQPEQLARQVRLVRKVIPERPEPLARRALPVRLEPRAILAVRAQPELSDRRAPLDRPAPQE